MAYSYFTVDTVWQWTASFLLSQHLISGPVRIQMHIFDNTKTQFEQSYSDTNKQITEVYEDMVDVVISTEQPKHQKVGDLWYKVIE